MATYYVNASSVSTNWGNAVNSGTPCTVATANANAVAGDLVLFQSGEYFPPNAPNDFEPAWYPANDGTEGNVITYRSEVRLGAIIHDAANANNVGGGRVAFGAFQNQYVTFDGFDIVPLITPSTEVRYTFTVDSSSNIHVQYCRMSGWQHSDHTNASLIGVYGQNSLSFNVYIHHNELIGVDVDQTPIEAVVNASAIYIFEAHHVYVYNNTIHDCNNAVSWKTEPHHIYVYLNFLYNVRRAPFFPTPEQTGLDVHEVHHNVCVNVNQFLFAEDPPAGGGTWTGLKVYNNTLYNDASHPLGIAYVAPSGTANVSAFCLGQDAGLQTCRGAEIYNNIFMTNVTSRLIEFNDDLTSDAMLTRCDYNCYRAQSGTLRYRYNAPTVDTTNFATYAAGINDDGEESRSITTNPTFVNPGGSTPEDYKLQGARRASGQGLAGWTWVRGKAALGLARHHSIRVPRPPDGSRLRRRNVWH